MKERYRPIVIHAIIHTEVIVDDTMSEKEQLARMQDVAEDYVRCLDDPAVSMEYAEFGD